MINARDSRRSEPGCCEADFPVASRPGRPSKSVCGFARGLGLHQGRFDDRPAITSLEVQPITGLELCWEARVAVSVGRPLYIIVMSSLSDEQKLAEALDC